MTNDTNSAANLDTVIATVHTWRNEGGKTVGVWVDGIPHEWTDRDVQIAVENLAGQGDPIAIEACAAVGSCWVDLTTDRGRVYLDG